MEHKNYLQLEEEKRKRARVTKTAISGPLVRWVSRHEEVKVVIQPPAPPPAAPTPANTSHPLASYAAFGYPYSYAYRPGSTYSDYLRFHQAYSQGLYSKSGSGDTQTQPSAPQQEAGSAVAPMVSTTTTTSASSAATLATQQLAASQQPQPIEKMETVAKNYVVHELGQHDGIRKANWTETMKAMFGDHVRWDEAKVYTGKGRPMCTFKLKSSHFVFDGFMTARPKHICPITGKQAVYLDPRTGVPYADARAFKVLTDLLEHEYIWNAELGCYVAATK